MNSQAFSLPLFGTLGYYTDASGRTYVRARYLKMDTTRWLTEDPVGRTQRELNLIAYVELSPLTFVDGSGLQRGYPTPCPKKPVMSCFTCFYGRLIGSGWDPQQACKIAKVECGSQIICDGRPMPFPPIKPPDVGSGSPYGPFPCPNTKAPFPCNIPPYSDIPACQKACKEEKKPDQGSYGGWVHDCCKAQCRYTPNQVHCAELCAGLFRTMK